jgi:hypothetical protein
MIVMKKKELNSGKTASCRIELPPDGCPGLYPAEKCLTPMIQLREAGTISCEGRISGVVLCDMVPVEGVAVNLSSSFPELTFTDPSPVTNRRGEFTTTAVVSRGTPIMADVRITAAATVDGKTVSDFILVRAGCIRCTNPVLTLSSVSGVVDCRGTQLSGRLTCDGAAVPNAAVSFTIENDSSRVTVSPNPAITNPDGTYTATLVPFTGIDATVTITASATAGGIAVRSETQSVTVECLPCRNPVIILDPLEAIRCRGVVTGRVLCDGRPLAGISVTLRSEVLIFQDNVVTTDLNGEFSSDVSVPRNTPLQEALYSAEAIVNGIPAVAINAVQVSCPQCENPVLELDNTGPISCEALVKGQVLCDGVPVPGVSVTLSSSLLTFNPVVAVTDFDGVYRSTATVPFPSPIQEVTITASATVGGVPLTHTHALRAGCVDCPNPAMNLIAPPSIECTGTIRGRVVCDVSTPIPGVPVFFDIVQPERLKFIIPNPAITDADGRYTAEIVAVEGASGTVTVSARATVGGIPISAGPFNVEVDCPFPPNPCPCKFKLDTQGGEQPGARIRYTHFGIVEELTGTLNITVNECGASAVSPCNPAVDNFNFLFNASNGDNFQFTQGRRTMITCEDNFTVAIVEGLIRGRVNNGPPRTYNVTIRAALNSLTGDITWEIFARDGTFITVETIEPFTAPGSPNSFIVDCP